GQRHGRHRLEGARLLHGDLPGHAQPGPAGAARGRPGGRRRRGSPVPGGHPAGDAHHDDPHLGAQRGLGVPGLHRDLHPVQRHRRAGRARHHPGDADPRGQLRPGRPGRLRGGAQPGAVRAHPGAAAGGAAAADRKEGEPMSAPTAAARPVRVRRSTRRRAGTALRYGLLLLVAAISIGPFLWQLSTALKGLGEDIYAVPPRFLPAEPTGGNFLRVGEVLPVWTYVWNSVRVALATVLLNVVGAALARLRFRGRRIALGVFVLALLVPGEAIMVALFLMMRSANLHDTLVAVVLPGMIGALNVLLMYNAFLAQPRELDEAAMIDGA